MKFGKSLRLVQNLKWNHKWADSYVDYKLLKQLIKALAKIDVSKVNSLEEVLDQTKQVLGVEFSFLSPSGQVGSFDLEANGDVIFPSSSSIASQVPVEQTLAMKRISSTGSNLSEAIPSNQNHDLKKDVNDEDTAVPAAAQHRLSRRASFSSSVRDIRQKSFMEVLRREFTKVDNFCRKEFRRLQDRVDDIAAQFATVDSKPNELGEMPSKEQADEKRKELRKTLLNLFQSIERAEAFLNINSTAIEKITKKFDKKVKPVEELNPPLMPQVLPFLYKMNKRHKVNLEVLQKKLDNLFHQHGRPSKIEEAETAKAELEELVVEDEYPTFTEMRLNSFPPESINRFRLVLAANGLAEPITVPVIVVKGRYEGPVLGITAALHGNELNGIPLIHKLLRELELDALSGTVIAIPVMNGPGFLRHQRGYFDGADLNRLFPGKPDGNCGQVYAFQCMQKIVKHFNYHIDMHTASFGRVNSLYVRADMNNRITHQMARLQDPQIIVHNTAPDGSLRSAAMKLGIPSITVEIGDPSRIHRRFVRSAFLGVENILSFLKMLEDDLEFGEKQPTICSRSFWMYSQHGGMLHVIPDINTWVEKDQVIARVRNVFGDIAATYVAPCDGIIVGKNVDPVCSTGDRILHLGVVEDTFPVHVDDGHV